MDNKTQQPIKIDADILSKGIFPTGIKSVRNMDIFNIDGVMRANLGVYITTPEQVITTFTANASTDKLTVANTLKNFTFGGKSSINTIGRPVTLTTTGTLPAPLATGTTYYVYDDVGQTTTLYLATTLANAQSGIYIDITDAGTGTHTITTTPHAAFNHFDVDKRTGTVYAQDANGRIWRYETSYYPWGLIAGNTLTSASGNGFKIWKDYIFAFRSVAVDVYGPLLTSPTWTNSWAGASSLGSTGATFQTQHTAFESQNGRLYIANSQADKMPLVASLQENVSTTFDPTNALTYTWNASALDLPDYEWITCFEEQNNLLMIGTVANKIYPWDKISDSFRSPIIVGETYIHSMRMLNNALYFGCGYRGNIYRTYGTTSEIVVDFSDDIANYPENTASCVGLALYPGGLLALMSCTTTAESNSGVYFIDINNGNRYSMFNSIGDGYQFQNFNIPKAIFSLGEDYQFFVSWQGQSGYGACDTHYACGLGPFRQINDKAVLITELFRVSDDSNNPRTFETVEIFLRKQNNASNSIKIAFRNDETSSFSTDITFTNSTNLTDAITGWEEMNNTKARYLQIRITLSISTDLGSSSNYISPELTEVRVV